MHWKSIVYCKVDRSSLCKDNLSLSLFFVYLAMTLADVKKFLSNRKEQLTTRKITKHTEQQRPVVYATCHVDDIPRLHKPRKGEESFRPLRHFDESGLHFTNDARKSVFFQQLAQAMETVGTSSVSRQQAAEDRAKWALFEQYGPELVEFLTDRRGGFKKEFEKVFIT